jgi:hypothetical protein
VLTVWETPCAGAGSCTFGWARATVAVAGRAAAAVAVAGRAAVTAAVAVGEP